VSRLEPEGAFFLMNDLDPGGGVDPTDPPYNTWGAFNSWYWTTWAIANPGNGVYDWTPGSNDYIETYLAGAEAFGKKVALSIMLMTTAGSDYTPSWLYTLMGDDEGPALGWPILPGPTGYFPMWLNGSLWNQYWLQFIAALGAKWDGDPRIHSIWICTGISGEAIFDSLGTDTKNPTLNLTMPTIAAFDAAFQTTPIFFLGGTQDRRDNAAYCASRGVHFKQNVLGADLINHTYNPPTGGVERGTAEISYYMTTGWVIDANHPTEYNAPRGMWVGYEHGDIESNPEDMYAALLTGLAHGMRLFDTDYIAAPGSELMQQIADIDTDATLGDFWTWAVAFMNHPQDQTAMWVGRDTEYTVLTNYEKGWIGPWMRKPSTTGSTVSVNATGYAKSSATYTGAPAAIKGTQYDDAGIGYCADANLTITASGFGADGDYNVTVIYSETGVGAGWQSTVVPVTVVDGAFGPENLVTGPCYVHLIVVEPDTLEEPNVAPNAPLSPMVEVDGTPMTNPGNVDSLTPDFSWTFSDDNTGDTQYAYQIIVGESAGEVGGGTGTWWDTGQVVAADHEDITYDFDAGASYALEWETTYYWAVRTWDDAGAVGPYCAVQTFTTREGAPPVTEVAPEARSPKCEGFTNPTEVNDLTPDLSWTFYDVNGDSQSRYRILAATSADKLYIGQADLWDTQQVYSAAGSVVWGGLPLAYDQTVYWRLRVWDDSALELPSEWTVAQQFTTYDTVDPVIPPDEGGLPIREHFRIGYARTLEWLGPTLYPSGIRATTPADPTAEGVALILSLSREEDCEDLVTRVYPQTSDGVTLLYTTRLEPPEYTISAAGQYVQSKRGEEAYGLIESWKKFDDVRMQQSDSLLVHHEYAANTLVDRSVEYLRQRSQVNTYYRLSVICNTRIRPGETIRVVYRDYTADGCYVSIDEDLYIVGVTTRVDAKGLLTYDLEVSTIDKARETEAQVLARAVKSTSYL